MNNEEQYFQEIHQATIRYFQQASNIYNSASNKDDFYTKIAEAFKPDIVRYGENLIPSGLTLIKLGLINADLSKFAQLAGGDQTYGNMMFVMQIQQTVQLMTAMVLAFGERGIWKLMELIDSKDEDMATLAVSCLEGKMTIHPQVFPKLKYAFAQAIGTALKLNIVLHLRVYGENEFGESFLQECKLDDIDIISEMVYLGIATNGNLYANLPFWRKNRH